MKKFMFRCLSVVAIAIAIQTVSAEVKACNACDAARNCDPCDEVACNPCDEISCTKQSQYFWGAWAEAGAWANQYGRTNTYNNGVWNAASGNTAVLQNVRMTDVQLNQMVFYGGKKVDGRKGIDFGGRVDAMFGTDAMMLQSEGLEINSAYRAGNWNWQTGDYGTAIPQAYAEVAFGKMSVKAGKFLSHLSSESPYSTERFFYSLSDTYAIVPHTLSGVVATYDVNKKLSAFGGWVQGYRMIVGNYMGLPESAMFFDSSKNNAFYGGFDYKVGKRVNLGYTALIGTNNERLGINGRHEMFVQSFVVEFKPNKRWDYKAEWVLRNDNFYGNATNWLYDNLIGNYAISQELIYKINKKWAVGGRFDWGNGYDIGYDLAGVRTEYAGGSEIEHYSLSLGANWTPNKWLTVKPEFRYDKFDTERAFNGFTQRDQVSGGCSVIVKR